MGSIASAPSWIRAAVEQKDEGGLAGPVIQPGGGRCSETLSVISLRLPRLRTQHSPAESVARQLFRRYGVVFRDLLARESLVQSWRDLLVQYRRMELQGEIRGGRFVSGFVGEQFALPEAVQSMRALRQTGFGLALEVKLSACDPLNLAGVILPGPRIPAVPTNMLVLRDGVVVRTVLGRGSADRPTEQLEPSRSNRQLRLE